MVGLFTCRITRNDFETSAFVVLMSNIDHINTYEDYSFVEVEDPAKAALLKHLP